MSKLKVHLIRSNDFSLNDFKKVVEFIKELQKIDKDNYKFSFHEDDQIIDADQVENRPFNFSINQEAYLLNSPYFANYFQTHSLAKDELKEALKNGENHTTWKALFTVCDNFRKANKIGDVDQVVLLTNTNNFFEENLEIHGWFGANSELSGNNSFIHTNFWELYLPGIDKIYPITYMILLLLIIKKTGMSYMKFAHENTHDVSIGCISDMTNDKVDVILKLRTGDICDKCLAVLLKKIDPKCIKSYCLCLDEIRNKTLFSRRGLGLYEHSKILIQKFRESNYPYRKIYFTEYDQYLDLNSRSISIYLYLLKNPKGLFSSKKNIEDTRIEIITEISKYYYADQNESGKLDEAKDKVRGWFTTNETGGNNLQVIKNEVNTALKKVILDKRIRKDYEIVFDEHSCVYKVNLDRKQYLEWN
jgi:hypothetical protein